MQNNDNTFFVQSRSTTAYNSQYTLRSSDASTHPAVLGLRQIFSAPACAALGLFGAEKTSHTGERCRTFQVGGGDIIIILSYNEYKRHAEKVL